MSYFWQPKPSIFGRITWNAEAPDTTDDDYVPHSGSIYRIAVHHCATPNAKSRSETYWIKQHQLYHKNTQQWGDIGYHYLIGFNGNIYDGRNDSIRGVHVATQNEGNIGICFIGHYGDPNLSYTTVLNERQENAFKDLASWLCYFYNINPDNIKGHTQWYNNSSCPEVQILNKLPSWKSDIKARLTGAS